MVTDVGRTIERWREVEQCRQVDRHMARYVEHLRHMHLGRGVVGGVALTRTAAHQRPGRVDHAGRAEGRARRTAAHTEVSMRRVDDMTTAVKQGHQPARYRERVVTGVVARSEAWAGARNVGVRI